MDHTSKELLEAKLSKDEIDAALDALSDILGAQVDQGDAGTGGNNPSQKLPQEYADAWNKIIADYDKDSISIADLQKLLSDISNGDIKELN